MHFTKVLRIALGFLYLRILSWIKQLIIFSLKHVPDDSFVLSLVKIPSNILNATAFRQDPKSGLVKTCLVENVTSKIQILQYLYYKPEYIGLDMLKYVSDAQTFSITTEFLNIRINSDSISYSVLRSETENDEIEIPISNRIELVTVPGQGPVLESGRTQQMLDLMD